MFSLVSSIDLGVYIVVGRHLSSLVAVSARRGRRWLRHIVGGLSVADPAFFSDNVVCTRWIRGPSCTGLFPNRLAIVRCAPRMTVGSFFGSQIFDVMVQRGLFGKLILRSIPLVCAMRRWRLKVGDGFVLLFFSSWVNYTLKTY